MSDASPGASASPEPRGLKLDPKVPIALIVAVALQTCGALIWAGGEAQRVSELERRLDKQQGVAERLARLEAESETALAAIARIEAKLDREAR
jgi:hypothetical protein